MRHPIGRARHCNAGIEPPSFTQQVTTGIMTMSDVRPAISFIGFGEAGQAIAAGLHEAGVERMAAWDILFPQPEGERLRQAGAASGVRCANSATDAVHEADIVISAVDRKSTRL